MKNYRWKKITFDISESEHKPIPIINNGAIAIEDVSGGRLSPLIILDTSKRPDIEELVDSHSFTASGDVKCTWGTSKFSRSKKIILALNPTNLKKYLYF